MALRGLLPAGNISQNSSDASCSVFIGVVVNFGPSSIAFGTCQRVREIDSRIKAIDTEVTKSGLAVGGGVAFGNKRGVTLGVGFGISKTTTMQHRHIHELQNERNELARKREILIIDIQRMNSK